MIRLEIDDSQILNFAKSSPARSKWAASEALKKTGGHMRKKLRSYIETGGDGSWQPQSELTRMIQRVTGKGSPLTMHGLGKMISFKYGRSKGAQVVRIGFLSRSVARIARQLQYGFRLKITRERLAFLHRVGAHTQKKTLKVPGRPIIEPFYRKYQKYMARYFEKNFFDKFFSKEKPGIKI
jgi:hypothetical protein